MSLSIELKHPDPGHRVWKIVTAAPCRMWSANDAHRADKYGTAKVRKAWRGHTYELLKAADFPRGLARISLTVLFHPVIDNRRDALNYADTAKPIIDAFGPPFVQKPTLKKPSGASAPGWSVIPDDTLQYLADTTLTFGDLWQDVITAPGWPLSWADVVALDNKWGGVTIVVGELPPVEARPKSKRVPVAKLIGPDTRRRLAVEAMTG